MIKYKYKQKQRLVVIEINKSLLVNENKVLFKIGNKWDKIGNDIIV